MEADGPRAGAELGDSAARTTGEATPCPAAAPAALTVKLTGGMGSGRTPKEGSVPEPGDRSRFTLFEHDPRGGPALPDAEDTPWTHGGPPGRRRRADATRPRDRGGLPVTQPVRTAGRTRATAVRPRRPRAGARRPRRSCGDTLHGTARGVVVDSPPGAGKSTLVVRAARELAAAGEPLMIVAQTNAQVDDLADRLADGGSRAAGRPAARQRLAARPGAGPPPLVREVGQGRRPARTGRW